MLLFVNAVPKCARTGIYVAVIAVTVAQCVSLVHQKTVLYALFVIKNLSLTDSNKLYCKSNSHSL